MKQQLSDCYNFIEDAAYFPLDRIHKFLNNWEPREHLPIETVKPLNEPKYWYCYDDQLYYSVDELKTEWSEIVFDLESSPYEKDSFWHPFLAIVVDQKNRVWRWYSTDRNISIPMPVRTDKPLIVFGHNVVAYDSQYFDYYHGDPVVCQNSINYHPYLFVDTMALAQSSLGLKDDEDKGGSKSNLVVAYKAFKKRLQDGLGFPSQWYNSVTLVNLSDLHQFLCGYPLNKSVREDGISKLLADDLFTQYQPQTIFEYCFQDCQATLRVAKELVPYCIKHYPSIFTWQGFSALATSQLRLQNWQAFIDACDKEYEEKFKAIRTIVNQAMSYASIESCPYLDWSKWKRGKNKDKYRWQTKIEESETVLGVAETVYVLRLLWEGKPIYAESRGRSKGFRTAEGFLPHPSGDTEANLGKVFSLDYKNFVGKKLTSGVLSDDQLTELFECLSATSQWSSYRKRYTSLLNWGRGQESYNIRPDICPIGTITGRTSSPIWAVLPKPKENKIGNRVWQHITTPYEGHTVISADFDSQESEIACLFTDAMTGYLISNDWVKIVMFGDKDKKTDIHNIVAQFCGIPRDPAKNLNFSWQYSAGITRQCQFLVKALGITFAEAEVIILKFIAFLSGVNGIANTTVRALDLVAKIPDYRLPLSNRLITNALNCKLTTDFFTNRRNFSIQSTGVDFLHAILTVVEHYCKERHILGVFLVSIHDRVYYSVPNDQIKQFAEILQDAHYFVKRLALETFWAAFSNYNNNAEVPEVLELKRYFSSVEKGSSFLLEGIV